MHIGLILRILGILLMLFSLTMLTPILVSFLFEDGSYPIFIISFILSFLSGLFLWLPFLLSGV